MVFVPITPELSSAFGTPVSIRMVGGAASINEGLKAAILSRRQSDSGNRISNVGGWQSRPDLLDWPEPELKLLMEEVDRSLQLVSGLPTFLATRGAQTSNRVAYKAYGWANVNESGN